MSFGIKSIANGHRELEEHEVVVSCLNFGKT